LSDQHDETTDHALMALVAQGDRGALSALVKRHQARVLGLAYRFLGQPDIAEDVAQEVFLKIWRNAASFRPEAQFTTWLYRLTANLCWDLRRRAARETRSHAMVPELGSAADPAEAVDSHERAERVRRALTRLPDRQRLAVILHRYEGLSHREIAEVTGWSAKAVESCLVRAYESLRKWLSDLDPRKPERTDR
jgi:RNA polymerase sigma-70 factor (ECF subfamily)